MLFYPSTHNHGIFTKLRIFRIHSFIWYIFLFLHIIFVEIFTRNKYICTEIHQRTVVEFAFFFLITVLGEKGKISLSEFSENKNRNVSVNSRIGKRARAISIFPYLSITSSSPLSDTKPNLPSLKSTPCPNLSPTAKKRKKMATTQLKSDAIMDLMKQHLSTDAGKELTEKIGLVYQINVAPKVPPHSYTRFVFFLIFC